MSCRFTLLPQGLAVDQGPSSYTRGQGTLRTMRRELRHTHINPLSRDGMHLLEGEPGIRDMLRLPKARVSDKLLIEGARRIIKNVRPFRETFIDDGYAADFLEKAEQAVDRLERVSSAPAEEVTRRALATRALPDVIRRGRRIMDAIDRLVLADLRNDAVHQTMWKGAYRIPGKMGRPKGKRGK